MYILLQIANAALALSLSVFCVFAFLRLLILSLISHNLSILVTVATNTQLFRLRSYNDKYFNYKLKAQTNDSKEIRYENK